MNQQKHRPKWDERTRRNYVAGWQRGASGEKPNPLLATKVYMSGYDAGKQAFADAKSASYIIGGLIETFRAPVDQPREAGWETIPFPAGKRCEEGVGCFYNRRLKTTLHQCRECMIIMCKKCRDKHRPGENGNGCRTEGSDPVEGAPGGET